MPKKSIRNRVITMSNNKFLVVFIISLLIRVVFFLVISTSPEKYYSDSDSYDYEDIAINLISYGVFSDDVSLPLTPDLYRTPVYPCLVAVIFYFAGKSVAAVILLHIVIGALLSAFMVPLVDALNLSTRVGMIAGLVLAFDPLLILTTFQLITETVFVGIFAFAIWTLAMFFKREDRRWLIAAAVLLAAATLTRPVNQFLPFFLLPLFLLKNGKFQSSLVWKNMLIFTMISMVVPYSWAFRNYLQTSVWTLSAIGDYNLLYYRAMAVIAEEEGLSDDEAHVLLQQQVEDEVKNERLDRAGEIELMRKKATAIFLQYPLTTLYIHAKGFLKVIANPGINLVCIMLGTQEIELDSNGNMRGCNSSGEIGMFGRVLGLFSQMNLVEKLVVAFEISILVGLYLGAAISVWKIISAKKWFLLYFLLSPVAYFSVLSAGGESVSRFRIPFLPFLAVLMGIAFSNVYLVMPEKSQKEMLSTDLGRGI